MVWVRRFGQTASALWPSFFRRRKKEARKAPPVSRRRPHDSGAARPQDPQRGGRRRFFLKMNTVHFLDGKTAFSISETLRRWGREEKQQARTIKPRPPKRPNLPRLLRYINGTQKCSTWNILKNATQSQACRKVFSRYPLPRPAKLKLQTFPSKTQKGETPHARQTIPLPQPRPAHRCGPSRSRQPPAPTRGIPRRPALRCIRYLWPLSRPGQI